MSHHTQSHPIIPWGFIGLLLLLASGRAMPNETAINPDAHGTAAYADRATGIRALMNPIPDRYIVVYNEAKFSDPGVSFAKFRTEVESLNLELVQRHKGRLQAQWSHVIAGMAIRMSAQAAAELARDPRVAFVEQDGLVQANTLQTPVTWGLDRIDQQNLPLDNRYQYRNDGGLVTAYVLDTGIRTTHNEFGGRASWGVNFTADGIDTDCHGHGTHVAGTLGGTTYGVAKKIALIAVKVLDCNGNGTYAGVISAIDWMLANKRLPAIANMSLSGDYSSAANLAISKASSAGIAVVVAAGNDGMNACNFSPASAPEAITVGATTSGDVRSNFSNFGPCLDLFAPGSDITSSTNSTNSSIGLMSGTSMASPHVAGVVAMLLNDNPTASPADLANLIIANSSIDKVANPGTNSPNRLLFTGNQINYYTLNLTSTGAAKVIITANPTAYAGITPYGMTNIPDGTAITLMAPATVGNAVFSSWDGCDLPNGANCTLRMTANKAVTVNYRTPTYALMVYSSGANKVAITADPATYAGTTPYGKTAIPDGTGIMLMAPDTSGTAEFSSWSGCDTSSGTLCTLTMTSEKTVTANFRTPTYNLMVNSSGVVGAAISANPSAYGGLTNYGKTDIPYGSEITLTAPNRVGTANFANWSGCNNAFGTSCTLTIKTNQTVTVNYSPPPYRLNVNSSGASGLAINAEPPVYGGLTNYSIDGIESGIFVTLIAPATTGDAHFSRWSGCDSASATRCTILMTDNKSVRAIFIDPNLAQPSRGGWRAILD